MILDFLPVHRALNQLLATPCPPFDITPVLLTRDHRERDQRVESLRKSINDVAITLRDLNALEAKVSELRRVMELRQAGLQQALGSCSALPTEILREIFLFVSAMDRTSSMSIAISHVSSRWRQICLDMPSLWTNIQLGHSRLADMDMLDTFSRRSRRLKIDISSQYQFPMDYYTGDSVKYNAQQEVGTVSLSGDVSWDALYALKRRGLRDPERLVLKATDHPYEPSTVVMICEGFYACESIHLHHVQLRYPSETCWTVLNITRLHMYDVAMCDLLATLETVAQGLGDGRRLAYLRLEKVSDNKEDMECIRSFGSEIATAISRLNLTHLDIRSCNNRVLDGLFSEWFFPLPEKLSIHMGKDCETASIGDPADCIGVMKDVLVSVDSELFRIIVNVIVLADTQV